MEAEKPAEQAEEGIKVTYYRAPDFKEIIPEGMKVGSAQRGPVRVLEVAFYTNDYDYKDEVLKVGSPLVNTPLSQRISGGGAMFARRVEARLRLTPDIVAPLILELEKYMSRFSEEELEHYGVMVLEDDSDGAR